MKAWLVSNYFGHANIVFADTRGRAKTEALTLEDFRYDDFVDIRVKRCQELDGMEDFEPSDNYWLNEDIRAILVRYYGLSCEEPDLDECKQCCANQYCSEWLEREDYE